ncbi:hypothetical protein HK097_007293 [Rhizophlyctis rosea]|uniref:Enoyl reductase (ER) domain-containing protein n=1 Tax=Rhizophlyctis rosea TaxID=64517 RepID=A0AAD5X2B5_9FUNG|nr:hypothetical protein HK097_007293 [Rhizophlyctis rosea]
MSSPQHRAALIPSRGKPMQSVLQPTKSPKPNEILIRVHNAALNPVDYVCRDNGFFMLSYPAVIGCDLAGVIEAVGSDLDGHEWKVGARVLANGRAFQEKGKPEYGALQEKVLVPVERVSLIPDHVSFEEAAALPLAVHTVFWGFAGMGLISPSTSWTIPQSFFTPPSKPAILIWGAASSVGISAVQISSYLGFTVYATASPKHHDYIKQLGAYRVFDYNDAKVVENIVMAVSEDGATMAHGYLAIGSFAQCVETLSQLRPSSLSPPSKMAFAGFQPLSASNVFHIARWSLFAAPKGVEAKFVVPPSNEGESKSLSRFIFGTWLRERLEKKEIVPAPKPRVVEGGLDGVDKALDELKKGVSGVKLVVKV